MTLEELKQVAMDCLDKSFKGDKTIPSHVVQAAVTILTISEPKK